jgi:excisionase family DNA binding protein
MSIEDLATYLGDSKRTIYKYIATGDCPPYMRISAKNIKFDRADVDAWLESKKIFPVSGAIKMSDIKSINSAKDIIKYSTSIYKLSWMPRAQTVLKKAEKQALKDGFELIGTQHILLEIFTLKKSIGSMVLHNLGITPNSYQKQYEILREQTNKIITEKDKLSEDIDNVIRCANEQASEWAHTYIGTEHLLVGILKAQAGTGFQILNDFDITLDKVREETAKLIVCGSPRQNNKKNDL